MANTVDSFFNGPPEAEREHIQQDFIRRARMVRTYGWDYYQYVWASGEVAAVAYLLNDDVCLREMRETEETVLGRWAFDLFGIDGGNRERATGWAETRAWFTAARAKLNR